MADDDKQHRWHLLAERFAHAVLAGDETTAHHQVRRLHRQGVGVRDLIEGLLAPTAVTVGECWADGTIGVAEEHRATSMMTAFLGELTPRVAGGRRGTAVVATWSGEHHTLPTAMAAAALREDHWNVEHIGAGVPAAGMLRFLEATDPDLAVLSVTLRESRPEVESFAEEIRQRDIPTLVGGPGRTLVELCTLAVDHSPARRPSPSAADG